MKFLWPFLLFGLSASAQAMNWEGHADWTDDFIYGEILKAAAPLAKPLPDRDCPVTAAKLLTNPYEQIPLPRHHCTPPKPDAGSGR